MRAILKDIFAFLLISALLAGFAACVTYARDDYINHSSVNMTA